MSHLLPVSKTFAPDDGLPERLEYRRKKSVTKKCKHKRTRCIRKGIDAYFQHSDLKDEPDDNFDDDGFDDFDENNGWYH